MYYTEHIIFCNQLRRENDQLRQSHPLRMAFYYTKIKNRENFKLRKGGRPPFPWDVIPRKHLYQDER